MTTVTAADGDWIAAHVLTTTYLRQHGNIPTIRRCRCQWGNPGWCQNGVHDACPRRTRPGWATDPAGHTETALVTIHGPINVYVDGGPRCRRACRCTCHPEGTP